MGIKRKRRPKVETDLVTDTIIAQEIVSPMKPLEKPNARRYFYDRGKMDCLW